MFCAFHAFVFCDLTSEVPKQARLGHQAVRQCGGFPMGTCYRTQWEHELGGSEVAPRRVLSDSQMFGMNVT